MRALRAFWLQLSYRALDKKLAKQWIENIESESWLGQLPDGLLECSFWHCDAPYLLNHLAESGQDEMLKLVTEMLLVDTNQYESGHIVSIALDIKREVLKK